MSPRKLTEDDKQEILKQYRNSEATTSTLAIDYGVSSSTISRFLKNQLSSSEYEDLIQQKRLARTPRGDKPASSSNSSQKNKSQPKAKLQSTPKEQEPSIAEVISTQDKESVVAETTSIPIRRRRASATSETTLSTDDVAEKLLSEQETKEALTPKAQPIMSKGSERPLLKKELVTLEDEEDDDLDVITLGEMLGEDIDDDEEEDDDDDEWEAENEHDITYPHAESSNFDVQILPLSAASFPRTCYLVIDRAGELIVKPLEDFADLGSIPETEIQQQTLPVFDNHRIAKRFSHRRERVIKVPDGKMLQKTSRHLQAKGITRLLIDGQIYSLSTEI